MSVLRDCFGAFCCCFPYEPISEKPGISRDLKRLSDWRAHPTLRQLELERHIADGGFSEVWLARGRSNEAEVVLKVVNLRKPGLQPADVEVLRGEARYLRLLDHPALLRCMDVFETKCHMVMILEYLSGGQMLDHLHRVDHYSEAQAARLFAQVAGAVSYMHNLNIVHRDIKPENVMFARPVEDSVAQGRQLRVKLIDLGMATVLVPPETPEEAAAAARAHKRRRQLGGGALQPPPRRSPPRGCVGSPGFIAPEVVLGAPHSLAMDVYSLGVLLFAMLTGRKPFSLKDSRNLSYAERSILEAPGLKDAIFLSLSAGARELCLSMMADDPRARPSAAEVMRHPFIRQSLAANGAGLRQPPLDDVIKRRITQLAALRRFRGLSFAMMASRREGQDLTDFTQQLTERRRALHRDLLVRAKTRQSLEMQQRHRHLQQRAEGGGDEAGAGATGRDCGSGSTSKRLRTQPPAARTPSARQPPQPSKRPAPAPATSPATPADRRVSADSVGSQQPLLLHHPHYHQQQLQASQDAAQSPYLSTADSIEVALATHPQLQGGCQQQLQGGCQQQLQGSQQRPPDGEPSQHKLGRHSLNSVASSASSRQPLIAGNRGGAGGAGGAGGVVDAGGVGGGALPSHHPSHNLLWTAGSGSHRGTATGSPMGLGKVLAHQHGNSQQHHHQQHQPQRPPLDPVVEPEEPVTPSTARQAQTTAPVPTGAKPPATAAAAAGWSNSRLPRPPPEPQPQPRAAKPPRQPRFAKHSELELAAADPLALIRELPAGAVGELWRAHSAPENLNCVLLGLRSSDGGRRSHGPAPAEARGLGRRRRLAAWAAAAAAQGMRWRIASHWGLTCAFSANSLTLELLENADLLAALTGVPLGQENSFTSGDISMYGGTAYGGGTPLPLTGPLAAALSAARASHDGRGGGGAAAAAASPDVYQRLRSGDVSAHQVARAVLAAARANSSSQRGGSAAIAAAAMAALRAGSDGSCSRRASQEVTPSRAASGTAGAGAAVSAPTRPVPAAAAAQALEKQLGRKPSSDDPWAAGSFTSPFVTVSQADVVLLPAGGLAARHPGQPRALFHENDAALPPPRASLDGPTAPTLPGAVAAGGYRSAGPVSAAAEEPLPLIRLARHGEDTSRGAYGSPSCDVTYNSNPCPSLQHLGSALPPAMASPAAAAAAAASAAVGLTAHGSPQAVAVATATPPLAGPPPRSTLTRRPSLALVDVDDQIAARRASLEESFHGGDRGWLRAPSLGGGGSGGGISDGPLSSASDVSSHLRSGSLTGRATGPLAGGLPGLLLELGAAVSAPSAAAAMKGPPHLARITECSDLGEPADGAAALPDSARRRRDEPPLPRGPALEPSPAPQQQQQQQQQRRSGTGGGGHHLALGQSGRGPGSSGDGPAGAPAPQWRSPFEALAAAPDPGSASKGPAAHRRP